MKFNNVTTRLSILVALLLMLMFCMSSVTIKSGATTDVATVDATSKAVRVTRYDVRGNATCQKATYSASTTAKTATAAGTGVFASFYGSGTKTIRLQSVTVTGTVGTAAVYGDVVLSKRTAATTSGTPVTLTQVPHDSGSAAGTATKVAFYTTLGTTGGGGGPIASAQAFMPITGTPATIVQPVIFSYDLHDEAEGIVLRGTSEGVELAFGTTTTNAPTLTVTFKWTEE